MIMPVGPNVLLKIIKKKSSIHLMSTHAAGEEAEAIVQTLGTKCTLGVEPGQKVMLKYGTAPTLVEQTDDHDLIIVPEISILYIKDWQVSEEAK